MRIPLTPRWNRLPWLNDVPAVLELYLAGDGAGEAAVNLLYGAVNPSGKLAETFPRRLSDTPAYLSFPGERETSVYTESVFVGYRYYDTKEADVLFPLRSWPVLHDLCIQHSPAEPQLRP